MIIGPIEIRIQHAVAKIPLCQTCGWRGKRVLVGPEHSLDSAFLAAKSESEGHSRDEGQRPGAFYHKPGTETISKARLEISRRPHRP